MKLDDIIKGAVKDALCASNGSQRKAAHFLGVSRWTIGRMVKKYGLDAFQNPRHGWPRAPRGVRIQKTSGEVVEITLN